MWEFCFQIRDSPPMIPTDTSQGYKQMKAKIGRSKVRPWKWMPFTNPARKVEIYDSDVLMVLYIL